MAIHPDRERSFPGQGFILGHAGASICSLVGGRFAPDQRRRLPALEPAQRDGCSFAGELPDRFFISPQLDIMPVWGCLRRSWDCLGIHFPGITASNLGRVGFVCLIAQVVDVYFDHIGVCFKIDIPDFFSDFGFGNCPALVADKVLHQSKFLWREFNPNAIPAEFLGQQIHFNVCK